MPLTVTTPAVVTDSPRVTAHTFDPVQNIWYASGLDDTADGDSRTWYDVASDTHYMPTLGATTDLDYNSALNTVMKVPNQPSNNVMVGIAATTGTVSGLSGSLYHMAAAYNAQTGALISESPRATQPSRQGDKDGAVVYDSVNERIFVNFFRAGSGYFSADGTSYTTLQSATGQGENEVSWTYDSLAMYHAAWALSNSNINECLVKTDFATGNVTIVNGVTMVTEFEEFTTSNFPLLFHDNVSGKLFLRASNTGNLYEVNKNDMTNANGAGNTVAGAPTFSLVGSMSNAYNEGQAAAQTITQGYYTDLVGTDLIIYNTSDWSVFDTLDTTALEIWTTAAGSTPAYAIYEPTNGRIWWNRDSDWVYLAASGGSVISVCTDAELEIDSSALVQLQWDWDATGDANKWGRQFQAYKYRRPFIPDVPVGGAAPFEYGYETITTKNRPRGKGRAFRYRMETEPGKDLHLYGYSIDTSVKRRI